MPVDSVIQLKCSCNQYPWGKQGKDSIAARLCQKTPGWDGEQADKDFEIDDTKSYAEMYVRPMLCAKDMTDTLVGGWAHTPYSPHTSSRPWRICKTFSTRMPIN
jgi:hypothetical protein